jgi:hypothetical protein
LESSFLRACSSCKGTLSEAGGPATE